MSDQAVLFSKWVSHWGIILAKGQLDHSYTFWTMSILIFSPLTNFGDHPIYFIKVAVNIECPNIKSNFQQTLSLLSVIYTWVLKERWNSVRGRQCSFIVSFYDIWVDYSLLGLNWAYSAYASWFSIKIFYNYISTPLQFRIRTFKISPT